MIYLCHPSLSFNTFNIEPCGSALGTRFFPLKQYYYWSEVSSPAHKNNDIPQLYFPPPQPATFYLPHVSNWVCLYILHMYIFFSKSLPLDNICVCVYTHAQECNFYKKWIKKDTFPSLLFLFNKHFKEISSCPVEQLWFISVHGYKIFLCMDVPNVFNHFPIMGIHSISSFCLQKQCCSKHSWTDFFKNKHFLFLLDKVPGVGMLIWKGYIHTHIHIFNRPW